VPFFVVERSTEKANSQPTCISSSAARTWTSFPDKPEYIQYGTLKWKLATKAPRVLYGQKLRPIKPAGVPNLKQTESAKQKTQIQHHRYGIQPLPSLKH
jgi:hypothetical protein